MLTYVNSFTFISAHARVRKRTLLITHRRAGLLSTVSDIRCQNQRGWGMPFHHFPVFVQPLTVRSSGACANNRNRRQASQHNWALVQKFAAADAAAAADADAAAVATAATVVAVLLLGTPARLTAVSNYCFRRGSLALQASCACFVASPSVERPASSSSSTREFGPGYVTAAGASSVPRCYMCNDLSGRQ